MNGTMSKYPISQVECVIVEIATDKKLQKKYFVPVTDKKSLTKMEFNSADDIDISECEDGIWLCGVDVLHNIPAPSRGSFHSLNYKIIPYNLIRKKEDLSEIQSEVPFMAISDKIIGFLFDAHKIEWSFASFYNMDPFSIRITRGLLGIKTDNNIFVSQAYKYIYRQIAKSENFFPPVGSANPIGFEYLFEKFIKKEITFDEFQFAINHHLSEVIFKNRDNDDEYIEKLWKFYPRFSHRLLSIMKEIDDPYKTTEESLKQIDDMIYNHLKSYDELYVMRSQFALKDNILLQFPLWMDYVEDVMKHYEEKKLKEKEERKAKRKAAKNENASGI